MSTMTDEVNPEAAPAAAETQGRRPVRVLVNAVHARSGGGVTYLRNMLPRLAADPGLDIHLALRAAADETPPDWAAGGVTTHRVALPGRGLIATALAEQIRVARLAREIGADVTFSPANYGPLFAPNPVVLLRNATGVGQLERRPSKWLYWALVYLATALSLRRCRRAIAVSEFARTTAPGGRFGRYADVIRVIPHGVAAEFSPPPEGTPREGFILAVSDIYVQKNLETLIRAVSLIAHRRLDIRLTVAGRPLDEGYFAGLQRLVAELGLGRNVTFLGEVGIDALVDLYRRCGVFVFPSLIETFGNPLVEAMASGAPIVCSNAAAMPEILGDGGLYFPPEEAEELAARIDQVLGNRDLARDLSARALLRARDFSWEKTAKATIEVLKSAAG